MSERLFFFLEIIAVFGLVIGFACWELYRLRKGMAKTKAAKEAANETGAKTPPPDPEH